MRLFTASILLILIVSCNAKDVRQVSITGNNRINDSNKPENKTFKLKPESNKSYRYNVVNINGTEQEINDEKLENNTKLELGVDYTFSRDTAAGLKLAIKYRTFRLSIKTGDEEKVLDAGNAAESLDPSEKIFGAFKDASLTARLDSVGNVNSISGYQEINKKMFELAEGDQNALQMLNGSIKEYVDASFFKQVVEQNFKFFTNRSLKEGDTIMQTIPVSAGFDFNMRCIYKVESLEDGIAKISVDGDFDMKDQEIKVEGTSVIATLKGRQTGEMNIYLATGLLRNSKTTIKIKGDLGVMRTEVPLKITITNSIDLVE